MSLTVNPRFLGDFVQQHELDAIQPQITAAHNTLHNGSGLGSDYLGWLNLPKTYDKAEFQAIKAAAKKIASDSDVLVVIGIGGSYLGPRAALEFLRSPNYNALCKDTPQILFAGNNISPAYLNEIMALCQGKRVSLNVISKSGTTTEPALAFRVLGDMLKKQYGDDAKDRIYCTTDKSRGALKGLADREGYQTFVIPDDVGGRYSVLTAVGLLPLAVAGIDIDKLMTGAADARNALLNESIAANDCYLYAALRNILYRKGKGIEMLVCYEPAFGQMAEWFKQLFGESEGKDGKGLFPASAGFSADLHSLGQIIQQGRRHLFETVVDIQSLGQNLFIQNDPANADGLNFLAGQQMSVINRKAMEGTILAHTAGGVPNIVLQMPQADEYELGYMIYFFEKACAISGYLLGVNPFDQPGVESYKRNMFALLGKPGYEKEREALEAKLL